MSEELAQTTIEQLHAIVRGRVQGVSFRYYTVQEARRLGVTGWVCNRPDLTVEVIAVGPREQLENMLQFLHEGSPAARVDQVEAAWEPVEETFDDFRVRHQC